MVDFVRVRDPQTGHHYTTSREAAVAPLEILDQPAVDSSGRPLPQQYHVTVEAAAKARTEKTGA